MGAIMLKVSWKILDPEEDKSKIPYRRSAGLDAELAETRPTALPAKDLGLVGFHVVTRRQTAPQWIWTSFEHVDNVPEQKDVDERQSEALVQFL